MRRLDTETMALYYPEGRETEAWRFLTHVGGCVQHLRSVAHVHNGVADEKIVTILPELAFNNAFVIGRFSGYEALAVVPTYNTLDAFSLEFGLPPDPVVIGCHEITHYVHGEQIAGFAWFWNLFGQVYSPQIGLDPWFHEGLAVYYETKLQPGTGRLAWPFWRGAFAAGFAGRRFSGGDLSSAQRDFHAGSYYLNGSQFVRFLVDRYGEDKLWKLINVQARSIFFPLFVNVRFWQAYDKTLSTLIDEFADEVAANLPDRARPPQQRVVRPAGNNARYARAPDGTEALIAEDLDRPAWLAVYGPDGRLRSQRVLSDVLPLRKLALAAPTLASGLSFSPDGRWLYFVALDLDPTYQASRLYRYDIDAGTLAVVHRDLRGPGGSLSPDGARYVFARADGDHHDLAELDIASGAVRVIAREPHGAFIANPRVSPDGTRVVRDPLRRPALPHLRHRPARRAAAGDAAHRRRSGPRPVVDRRPGASCSSRARPPTPVSRCTRCELDSGRIAKLTDAPFLAFQPSAAGGRTLRFLNREGWRWTLDEIALPAGTTTPQLAAAAPTPPAARRARRPRRRRRRRRAGRRPRRRRRAGAGAQRAPRAVATNVIPAVVSDTPASAIDHLFIPSLYGPTIARAGRAATFVGGVLSGGDRLERHRWALAGYYQFIVGNRFSGSFAYSNRQLAPLTLTLAASQFTFADVPAGRQRYRDGRRLHAATARAPADVRCPAALLRQPGLARLRADRELSPRRSAALLPLRRLAGAAPVREPSRHLDLAVPGREPAVLRRRSTPPRTRSTGTPPASPSSTCAARWPPRCRCRSTGATC